METQRRKHMESFIHALNDFLWGPPLIILMIVTGLYFTIRSGAFQIVHFPYILKRTVGILFHTKEELKEEKENNVKGLVSPFEAIATAVGGSVGYGNIAAVATAITIGGPGAVFWMWFTALLGMLIKQVEVTLAVYYRRTDEEGNPYGGPTYYMERGLGEERGFGKLWMIPAFIFGIGIFSTFFITASNYTTSKVVAETFGIPKGFVSFCIMIIVSVMVWGGIKRLARIFTKLVPIMSLGYLFFGILIIILNIENLPSVIVSIFHDAFTGTAAFGGFAGVSMRKVISIGMARSVYSNEAGWGSSPMIHASSKTRHPIEQGLWGSFEVFVDTFIVCSITAISVLITEQWTSGAVDAELAMQVFGLQFGQFGRVFITLTMMIFALTTSGGWYAYYETVLRHLAKDHPKLKNIILVIFKRCYAIPPFLLALYLMYVGDISIWTLVDITSGIPTFINVIVILILSKQYFKLLKDYKGRYMNIGEYNEDEPIFYEDKIEKEKK